jgi:hypothetical protein
MDNDAFKPFDPDLNFELSKIIKRIAKEVNEIECIERTKTIWDINGNKIGYWKIIGD